MSKKEDIESRAAAVAASILGVRAERRDFGGGQQIRDFDLVFPNGKREPLEITRHIDQPALETWERTRGISPAPSLSRYWTLDVPHKAVSASGIERPFDVREFLKEVEPALRELEEAGCESFDVGLGRRDPAVAQALETLTRIGANFGRSRVLPPGVPGQINLGAPVGGWTSGKLVAEAIEAEASDPGNQRKLSQPAAANRRHLFVIFDPSSGSAYNAVDRGMLGRLPNLPFPITTAWAASGFRVFYTTPPDGWVEGKPPQEVYQRPEKWVN